MLIRQTLLYLPAQVLGPLLQLVSMVAWTHFLTPSELGLFALIVAAQELIFSPTLFWFSLFTLRHHDALESDNRLTAFLNSETAVMITASAAAAFAVLALPLFLGDGWTASLLAVTMVYTASRGLVAHLSDRARAEHDTLTYSLMQILWPLLGLVVALVLLTFVSSSVTTLLLAYSLAHLAALAVAAVRLRIGLRPLKPATEIVSAALRYGLPLVVGSILVWAAVNSLRFIIEWKEGAAAVGLVTVGWGLGQRVAAFASMLVTAAAFPLAVKKAREETMEAGQVQLERNGLLLLAALAPASAGLWLISEPAVRLLIAEPFQAITIAVLPFAILAGALRSFRLHFGEQVFLLRNETVVPLVNDAIDAIAAAAGTLFGLLAWGLEGAVMGAAIGAALSAIVTFAWGWLAHRFTLPVLDALRIALATGLMVLAVHLMPLTATVLSLLVAVAVGAGVYALSLAILYPDILRRAREVLRKPAPDLAAYPEIVETER